MWLFFLLGLLTKAIADAHLRTCLYTNEQIERMKGQLAPQEQVETYKNMVGTQYQISCQLDQFKNLLKQ